MHDNERKRKEKIGTTVRLNQFLAHTGVCARRYADTLIQEGKITVNNAIMTTLGYKVQDTDIVKYRDKRLKIEKKVYIIFNKPKDVITTSRDPKERKTVLNYIQNACSERIYPVGRLDRNTTGLLLLTNDGLLAQKLAHPSNNINKVYHVKLSKPISHHALSALQRGIKLEDGIAQIDAVTLLDTAKTTLLLTMHLGKNRLIRRIFEHLSNKVVKLDRIQYANLVKKNIAQGKWRFLSQSELTKLRQMATI